MVAPSPPCHDRRVTALLTPTPPASVLAKKYRALSVGLIALITLVAFEHLAVATIMPTVGRELDGYHLYGLAFSGVLAASLIATVVGGRWADAKGPYIPLYSGLVAFITGLLVAGLAPTMELFLAGRFLQGFGGGLFNVAVYVLVARVYPPEMHPRVFSLFATAWVLPSVIGPGIAGFVTEQVSWRLVFLAVPVLAAPAALALWWGLSRRREGDPESATMPADRLAARLAWAFVAATGAALLQYGSGSANTALTVVGVVALVVALVALLPKGTIVAARGLPGIVALRGVVAGTFFAGEVMLPLALQGERHLSEAQAGLALTIGALSWSAGSWFQGREFLSKRAGLRAGTGLLLIGLVVTALAAVPQVPLAVPIAGWLVAALGIGVSFPTLSVRVLEVSAPGEQGKNTASMSVGESATTIVTVAVATAVFTASGAYLVSFGLVAALALAGVLIAGRAAG